MAKRPRPRACATVAAALLVAVLVACGSASGQQPAQAPSATASQPASTGFVGYKWTVLAIAHAGKTTQVAAGDRVYLLFTPNGDFGANEPINYHGGTYKLTPGGFTTHGIYQTLVGSIGPPSVAVEAISAFADGTHALAKVSSDTLTVTFDGYTLTAHRAARQPNFPPPQQTSGPTPGQSSAPPATAG